jgi:hypothetical protein
MRNADTYRCKTHGPEFVVVHKAGLAAGVHGTSKKWTASVRWFVSVWHRRLVHLPVAMVVTHCQLREMSDKERAYAEVIRAQGAEFLGMQPGLHGALVLFTDPESWTTLAVYEVEFSPGYFAAPPKESAGVRRCFTGITVLKPSALTDLSST